MEMATRSFDSVSLKNKKLVVAELRQIPELRTRTFERARQTLRMFALLHDVGHPAFSHAAEDVIPNGNHESVSLYAVDKILRAKLESLFFRGITDLIVRLFQKSADTTFFQGFVSGEIDMDRIDYLLRDSLHCGVEYGKFDFRRLIESLKSTRTGTLVVWRWRSKGEVSTPSKL
jgi:HD superfamily phosphohydrolase